MFPRLLDSFGVSMNESTILPVKRGPRMSTRNIHDITLVGNIIWMACVVDNISSISIASACMIRTLNTSTRKVGSASQSLFTLLKQNSWCDWWSKVRAEISSSVYTKKRTEVFTFASHLFDAINPKSSLHFSSLSSMSERAAITFKKSSTASISAASGEKRVWSQYTNIGWRILERWGLIQFKMN